MPQTDRDERANDTYDEHKPEHGHPSRLWMFSHQPSTSSKDYNAVQVSSA
ncbi:MAG: hypothetical protein WBP91_04320 [Terriglobales bacterium]